MASLEELPTVPIPELTPLRIAGIYFLFGITWILFSDAILWALTNESTIRLQLEAAKGTLFVLASTGVIYALSSRARQKQAETQERLRRQTRQLSIVHRILRHNLRNIATVISGRIDAARQSEDPDQHLRIVERKANRMTTLAEKASLIRGVSTEEGDRRVHNDLAEAVAKIVDQRRQEYPAATIELEGPDSLETMVPSRLGFAINELIENAVVHAGPEPQVRVTLEADSQEVRITIADDGPGLPNVERTAIEGDVEKVLDHSEGVGLWLVRLIVEKAGGRLAFSEAGIDGSAITLAFPRIEGEATTSASEGPDIAAATAG